MIGEDRMQLLEEANRRGILSGDKKALYDEAVSRGLIGNQKRSTAEEIVRPPLQAIKSSIVGTIGNMGDLAQEAVALPSYLGNKAARSIEKSVYGDNLIPEYSNPNINTISPAIREGFDSLTGGLTKPQNKTEEYLQTAEEIMGGITAPKAAGVIGGAVNSAPGLLKKGLQKITGVNQKSPELVKAFEDSGVNPTLANITEGQTTKTFQNLLSNLPGSRGIIEKATQDQIDNITKQIAGITNNKGGTIQQTGKTIQEGAENLSKVLKNRTENLYNNLDQFIPKNEQGVKNAIPTDNFQKVISDPKTQDVLAVKGGTVKGLIKRFGALIDDKGNIPYDRLKIFRTTIGEDVNNYNLSGNERAVIKNMYGKLSEDMKAAVIANGGEKGLQAFNKANNTFYRYGDILDKKINPLIDSKTPEAVYSMAMSGSKQGGTNIKGIMKSLAPDQQDFVRGTITNRMGLANSGAQDATGEIFSPSKFLTGWNDLSPEAKVNIYKTDQIKSIKNLNKVISTLKETGKARQTSNNLPYATWLGLIGLGATGVVGVPKIAGAVGSANITARMMTNPKFINWLAKAPKTSPKNIPSHLKELSIIATHNPDISKDVLNYLGSITNEENQTQNPE